MNNEKNTCQSENTYAQQAITAMANYYDDALFVDWVTSQHNS